MFLIQQIAQATRFPFYLCSSVFIGGFKNIMRLF